MRTRRSLPLTARAGRSRLALRIHAAIAGFERGRRAERARGIRARRQLACEVVDLCPLLRERRERVPLRTKRMRIEREPSPKGRFGLSSH
jgi:hypothetical protein